MTSTSVRLALILPFLLLASSASAQFTEVFFDNFDDQNIDEYFEGDIIGQILTGITGDETRFQEITFPDGGVRITSPVTPNPEFGPARGGIALNQFTFTNFAMSADVIDRGDVFNSAWCLLSRMTEIGPGTSDGYAVCGGNVAEDQSFFAINLIVDEVVTNLANTTEDAFITVDPDADLQVHFRGVGNHLTASLFDMADLNTPLIELSARDATHAEGVAGLLAGAGGPADMPDLMGFGDVTFDNFSLSVPEPNSGVGMFMAGIGCLVMLRRRSSSV